jgi:hypothetical protein
MGVSTDGLLLYGWLLEEYYEFPWGAKDVDDWWREANGYKPPFELFDERGEYIGGRRPAQSRIDEYFDPRYKWDAAHPMPFTVENYCSDDYPMYAIVIKSIRAYRGSPVEIGAHDLETDKEAVERTKEALSKHGLELEGEPKWWLAPFWG